jgi:hypothetical protein
MAFLLFMYNGTTYLEVRFARRPDTEGPATLTVPPNASFVPMAWIEVVRTYSSMSPLRFPNEYSHPMFLASF